VPTIRSEFASSVQDVKIFQTFVEGTLGSERVSKLTRAKDEHLIWGNVLVPHIQKLRVQSWNLLICFDLGLIDTSRLLGSRTAGQPGGVDEAAQWRSEP
jgi:hypothetical protein